MPYLARDDGQSEEEYEKAVKEFNEEWYSYIADGKKEMRDIFLKASLAMEAESKKQAQLLGTTNDNSHDPQVPAPTVAERKAVWEAAIKEAERAVRERVVGRQVVSQHFLIWMTRSPAPLRG